MIIVFLESTDYRRKNPESVLGQGVFHLGTLNYKFKQYILSQEIHTGRVHHLQQPRYASVCRPFCCVLQLSSSSKAADHRALRLELSLYLPGLQAGDIGIYLDKCSWYPFWVRGYKVRSAGCHGKYYGICLACGSFSVGPEP